MESLFLPLKKLLKGNKKIGVLILLGIIGIIFIAFGSAEGKAETDANEVQKQSDIEYCAQLEDKIKELVIAITGSDTCVVAVTLENSGEYVYADQNTVDLNQTEDKASDTVATKESRKSEQEYIIVEGKDGNQTALVVTEKKPSVRGVAIVSGGINNMNYDTVSSCISSMLGIPSRKISISEAG